MQVFQILIGIVCNEVNIQPLCKRIQIYNHNLQYVKIRHILSP
jgi:hypothetical protein